MTERQRPDEEQIPEFHGDTPREEKADDDQGTHGDGTGTGTDTDPTHSEREWGGDQDIDTFGQV